MFADRCPQPAAQRRAIDGIQHSPRLQAQRKMVETMKVDKTPSTEVLNTSTPLQARFAVVQREDNGFDDDGVDTEGADAEQGHAIAATQFDEALQGREMPLSDYIAMREREIGDSPIIQMAAPFGGSSTNTYHVGLTGKTHTVTYNRIGQGGIDFDNPHSVAPAFGTPIQNNGDSVNILFKYKGIDYIDIKPKGTYVYTWAANKHARSLHFRAANLMKGYGGSGQPYGGWTWHHQAPSVSPRGTMVPVLTDVHKRHNHNGGVFLW